MICTDFMLLLFKSCCHRAKTVAGPLCVLYNVHVIHDNDCHVYIGDWSIMARCFEEPNSDCIRFHIFFQLSSNFSKGEEAYNT